MKLIRNESELVDAIRPKGQSEVTISEMQHVTGRSYSVIYKIMHGSVSRGYQYSGLLEKCMAVSVCDRTLVTDESERTAAHHRAKAYTWDSLVYDTRVSDVGCWLEGYGDRRREDPDDEDTEANGGIAKVSGREQMLSQFLNSTTIRMLLKWLIL